MKKLVLLVLLCLPFSGKTQSTAPVAGDVMALLDLLAKDYPLDLPDRNQTIATDRHKALVIFQSYAAKDSLGSDSYSDALDSLSKWQKTKDDLAALKNASPQKDFSSAVEPERLAAIAYFNKQYSFDEQGWVNLGNYFKNQKSQPNSYLEYMAGQFKLKYQNLQGKKLDKFASPKRDAAVQKSIPFFGGDLAFSTAIDGLSRFMAKRIKQEIALYGIKKIREYLENPTEENYGYEVLAVLPSTCQYLKSYNGDQILNFPNQLKQYIESDLNNLLKNAANLRYTPRIIRFVERYPDLDFAFEGLELLPRLSEIKNPVDFFTITENSRNLERWRNPNADYRKYDLAQGLRMMSMFAFALSVEENGEQKFVSAGALAQYISPEFYFLFVGLMAQQDILHYHIDFKKSDGTKVKANFKQLMVDVPVTNAIKVKEKMQILKSTLMPIAEHAEKIYNLSLDIRKKKKNGEAIPFQNLHDLADEFISFASEVALGTDKLQEYDIVKLNSKADLSGRLSSYFDAARTANEIFADLHAKRYAHALTLSIGFSEKLYENKNFLYQLPQISPNATLLHQLSTILAPKATLTAEEMKKLTASLPILEAFQAKIAGKAEFLTLSGNISTLLGHIRASDTANTKTDLYTINGDLKTLGATLLQTLDIKNDILKKIGFSTLPIQSVNREAFLTALDQYTNELYDHLFFGESIDTEVLENISAQLRLLAPQVVEASFKGYDVRMVSLINFLNDMASATDAEGVENAIEAFALPAGSSSIKDGTEWNLSLNGFPGVLGGAEFTDELSTTGFVGFTVPIGLYFQPWASGKHVSWGFFVPIIDIGAPVRFRLDDNNETETLPDFEFKDIFSPGLYLSMGLTGNPVAFNLGVQYGPKLRDIPSNVETSHSALDSFRVGIGVTIDIPLLTLVNRPK